MDKIITSYNDYPPYIDEAVYVYPKCVSKIEGEIMNLFKRSQPRKIHCGQYERTKLRWMKPDGKGGLVPR